jgi:CRP-like cAMP-binding protein
MINLKELEQLPLLSKLEPETLQEILRHAFIQTRPAGFDLNIEGAPAEFCYLILSGQVRALRMSRDGRMQVLSRLGPGEALNIISLLKEDRLNQASIETLTTTKLLTLDQSTFFMLVAKYPDFSRMILQIMADRMEKMTNLAADLSLHTVRTRLARFLLDLANQPQSAGGWTQDEIAAHIGTVRDVVGRLLREFESEGLIQRKRQQIAIIDRSGLLRVADQVEK